MELPGVNTKRMLRQIALVTVASLGVAAVSTALASYQGQAAADQVTDATYRYFLGDNQGIEGILYTHEGDIDLSDLAELLGVYGTVCQ
jgi:malonyl CoA-acyl carrier protein transacylase